MEFLGIGPLELLLILLLALIILGPKDLEKTAKTIGKGLNQLVRSDTWKTMNEAVRQLRTLPNKLMREAHLEDIQKETSKELAETTKEINKSLDAWTQPGPVISTPENPPELPNTIAPPEKDGGSSQ